MSPGLSFLLLQEIPGIAPFPTLPVPSTSEDVPRDRSICLQAQKAIEAAHEKSNFEAVHSLVWVHAVLECFAEGVPITTYQKIEHTSVNHPTFVPGVVYSMNRMDPGWANVREHIDYRSIDGI